MASSWFDLPLDLLISIRNKLLLSQHTDINSFCLVCFQWRSVVPVSNPCSRYSIYFDYYNNVIRFTLESNNDTNSNHFISLPFFSSSFMSFLCPSNGWLVFTSYNNKTLHLFNPVSNRRLIFPSLHRKLFRRYNKARPTAHKACDFIFEKVVVSSSLKNNVAVAAIIRRSTETIPTILDKMLVFCRHVNGAFQRWSLLMERSNGIADIVLVGDGQLYAIGKYWEFYMLDEKSPLIRLKRFKLWMPKHNLEIDEDYLPPFKRLSVLCDRMEESGETNLKIYETYWRYRHQAVTISLKINVAKLHYLNKFNITSDTKWSYFDVCPSNYKAYFTPSLRKYLSK